MWLLLNIFTNMGNWFFKQTPIIQIHPESDVIVTHDKLTNTDDILTNYDDIVTSRSETISDSFVTPEKMKPKSNPEIPRKAPRQAHFARISPIGSGSESATNQGKLPWKQCVSGGITVSLWGSTAHGWAPRWASGSEATHASLCEAQCVLYRQNRESEGLYHLLKKLNYSHKTCNLSRLESKFV